METCKISLANRGRVLGRGRHAVHHRRTRIEVLLLDCPQARLTIAIVRAVRSESLATVRTSIEGTSITASPLGFGLMGMVDGLAALEPRTDLVHAPGQADPSEERGPADEVKQ